MNEQQALRDASLKLYQEHMNQWRHYETQRAAVAGSILAIVVALIGLIVFDKVVNKPDLPLTGLIGVLGLLGAVFSLKQHERATLHLERARQCRYTIDATFEDLPLSKIKIEADRIHASKFPWLIRVKTHKLWLLLYGLLALIGTALSVIALFGP